MKTLSFKLTLEVEISTFDIPWIKIKGADPPVKEKGWAWSSQTIEHAFKNQEVISQASDSACQVSRTLISTLPVLKIVTFTWEDDI